MRAMVFAIVLALAPVAWAQPFSLVIGSGLASVTNASGGGSGGTSASYFTRSTNDLTYAADMKNWYEFSGRVFNVPAKMVDKIGFRCLKIGTGGTVNFTARIFTDNDGKPGTLIATFETRNASTAPSGSYDWWYFTGTAVSFSANTAYHVTLRVSSYQNADNYLRWLAYYDTSGPVGWHSDDGASWPTQETFNSQPCVDLWGY